MTTITTYQNDPILKPFMFGIAHDPISTCTNYTYSIEVKNFTQTSIRSRRDIKIDNI